MFAIAPLLPGFHVVESTQLVTTTPGPIIEPAPRRAILYISNTTGDVLYLWIGRAADGSDAPHIVVPDGSMLRFTWGLDGPMSTFGYLAARRVNSGEVGIVEVHWHPDQLVQSLGGL